MGRPVARKGREEEEASETVCPSYRRTKSVRSIDTIGCTYPFQEDAMHCCHHTRNVKAKLLDDGTGWPRISRT